MRFSLDVSVCPASHPAKSEGRLGQPSRPHELVARPTVGNILHLNVIYGLSP
jgi:hypothetical protein